jgi:hypothetical protein
MASWPGGHTLNCLKEPDGSSSCAVVLSRIARQWAATGAAQVSGAEMQSPHRRQQCQEGARRPSSLPHGHSAASLHPQWVHMRSLDWICGNGRSATQYAVRPAVYLTSSPGQTAAQRCADWRLRPSLHPQGYRPWGRWSRSLPAPACSQCQWLVNTSLVRQLVPITRVARPTAHVHERLQEVMRRLSIATQDESSAYISDHGHEVVDMVVTRMLHQGHASAFTLAQMQRNAG